MTRYPFLPPLDEHSPPVEGCDCLRCEREREYERQWLADAGEPLVEVERSTDPKNGNDRIAA